MAHLNRSMARGHFMIYRHDTAADGSGAGGSVIRLDMSFEFANKLIDLAIGPIFREIVRNLVGAFQQRAAAVYGGLLFAWKLA